MTASRLIRIMLPLALAVLAAAPAQAIRPVQRGEDSAGGLFLRFSMGYGDQQTAAEVLFEDSGDADMEFSGDGLDLNFAIGGFVAEDLALHATFFGWTATDPTFSWGPIVDRVSSDLALSAFGAGLTWYALPTGLYLSGSAGFADLNIDDAESDAGLAVDLTLGKEWWVDRSWSLGLAGSFGWHSVPEAGLADHWSGHSLALRFSASRH